MGRGKARGRGAVRNRIQGASGRYFPEKPIEGERCPHRHRCGAAPATTHGKAGGRPPGFARPAPHQTFSYGFVRSWESIAPTSSKSTGDQPPIRHHRGRRNRRRNARLPSGVRGRVCDDRRTIAPGFGRDGTVLRVDQRHPRQRPRPRTTSQLGHRGLPSPRTGTGQCARDRLERCTDLVRESGRVGAPGRRAHRLGP